MKEDRSIFLKVDGVEPVFKTYFPPSDSSCMDGIKVWIGNEGHLFPCDRYTVCDPDEAREAGRHQVVKLARELAETTFADRGALFGYFRVSDILDNFSYDKIVEKLNSWKKEKEKIHVKDEVQHKEFGAKAVVIGIQRDEYGHDHIYAITKKKEFITDAPASDYTKTGVHVEDLDAYLEV